MTAEQPDPELTVDGLSIDEVGVLWAFLHGDIMVGGIRQRLREHWGLCARHAWGHAVVEIELWESGAGVRAGHQPFDVGVLYNDLLEAMRRALISHPHAPERALRRRGECYVCAQLRPVSGEMAGPSVGYAGFNSEPLTDEANQFVYTRRWLTETVALWTVNRCPMCTGRHGTGQLCRAHLLGTGFDQTLETDTLATLTDVNTRLHRLVDSMTEKGEPSTPADDTSWIEALGWFHGWSFPNALITR